MAKKKIKSSLTLLINEQIQENNIPNLDIIFKNTKPLCSNEMNFNALDQNVILLSHLLTKSSSIFKNTLLKKNIRIE